MYKILAQGETINIVVREDANEFLPYAMKGTSIYSPRYDWAGEKPKDGGKRRRLAPALIEEAEALLEQAAEKWQTACRKSAPPDMALNTLIADSVAKLSADSVVEAAIPMLDKFIAKTYGIIPRQIEVTTPKSKSTITGVVHEKFETVLNLVNCDIPVFLSGAAGCGKNVLCKQIADALESEFYFSNAVTQEYKLTGFIDANGNFHETQFYKAFTDGGLFMLDEIDASTPEVLVILNAAIANKYFDFPAGRTKAHENFRIVAAGNTYGTGANIEYTGRYQLDAASLDRFAIVDIDYSKTIEEAIACGDKDLLEFIWRFRDAVKKTKIKFTVSYRAIERLHKLNGVFDMEQALKIGLLRSLDFEDARMITNNMVTDISNPYIEALQRLVN